MILLLGTNCGIFMQWSWVMHILSEYNGILIHRGQVILLSGEYNGISM